MIGTSMAVSSSDEVRTILYQLFHRVKNKKDFGPKHIAPIVFEVSDAVGLDADCVVSLLRKVTDTLEFKGKRDFLAKTMTAYINFGGHNINA